METSMSTMSSPRRTHRKRTSALRLSSDTTSTLPEYKFTAWQRSEDPPSDQPPDYPDSADEADEETDSDNNLATYLPPLPSIPTSPRRSKRFPVHRRRHSSKTSIDPYLDSLLERSVHALEMSNALLQSSASTPPSLPTILAPDMPSESSMLIGNRGSTSRNREITGRKQNWLMDLEEISRGVEDLFEDGEVTRGGYKGRKPSEYSSISSSLPSSSSTTLASRGSRRRPSLDMRQTNASVPQLRLTPQDRSQLIAPPPRALTQYVASTTEPDYLTFPSTLGLRAAPSHPDWRPLERSPSGTYMNPHASVSSPVLVDKRIEPSTPAYNMLSTFVTRGSSSGSSTPSLSISAPKITSFISRSRRGSSSTSNSLERGNSSSRPPLSRNSTSPERHRVGRPGSSSRSNSMTPKQQPISPPPLSPHHHCDPIEEVASSSSDDGCPAKLTVQSLRKILDEQPAPASVAEGKKPDTTHLRAPAFHPFSPTPSPTSSTSTATASISRLYTKGTHSSSTRPPTPPKQSSLKRPSGPNTPTAPSPTPTVLSIPDMLSAGVVRALGGGSGTSSGRSTPKRISFAELPESYASSRPGGSSSKFKKGRKKSKHGRSKSVDSIREAEKGWWATLLIGAVSAPGGPGGSGPHVGSYRQEERVEDRIGRSWLAKTGSMGGVDDWVV